MKLRWTLSRKILCLALLNLLLLGAAFLLVAGWQFRLAPESLLLGPTHDRILAIANTFSLDFESAPPASREALLAAYGRRYSADAILSDPQGRTDAVTGSPVALPPQVMDQMRRIVPPPRGDPPPRGEDPPFDPPPGPPRGRRGPPPPRPPFPPESVFLTVTRHPTEYWAGARILMPGPDEARGRPRILLLRARSIFNTALFFDWRWWLGVPLTVIGISVICWLPFLHGLTRSIARMDRVTEQIALGRFDVLVANMASGHRNDELGHLGRQIDRMSSRLESFVKDQKRFLGDIAHELCAPIARIQFALGILEQRAEEARRHDVAVLHQEIQEMSGLVNELLLFSKAGLDAGGAPLAPVSLGPLVERAVAREAYSGASVTTDVPTGLSAIANESLLLRALSNVVRNAVRYAGAAGPIAIFAGKESGQIALSVADCGPGLPDSELEAVFTPFYRPEFARTRETGGVGLGLAIVRTCVAACSGTVEARNRKPSGLEVIIRLPAAP